MSDYTLLIVDDEQVARENIISVIDWDRVGIRRILEASDGYRALELMREEHPDIVILDLRMPEMSGTELLQQMREQDLQMPVIVSSGYRDFDAARQMLSLGLVSEYLLKPVNKDMMFEAVLRCVEKLDAQREGEKDRLETAKTLRQAAVRAELFGYPAETEQERASLPPGTRAGTIVCYDSDRLVPAYLQERADDWPSLQYCFPSEKPGYLALYLEGSDCLYGEMTRLGEQLVSLGTAVGIGRVCDDLTDLSISYNEAMLFCEYALFSGSRNMTGEAIRQPAAAGNDWIQTRDLERLLSCVRESDLAGIDAELDALFSAAFQTLAGRIGQTEADRDISLMLMKARIAPFIERTLEDYSQVNLSGFFLANTLPELHTEIRQILYTASHIFEEMKRSHKAELIEKAKHYVEENYGQRITLESTAEKLYVNPSHLSKLFSDHEGCGFSEYLTRIRIGHAKDLLKDRDLKIYEVADAVGYGNPKYFIRVFKEKTGFTPAQYRETMAVYGVSEQMTVDEQGNKIKVSEL